MNKSETLPWVSFCISTYKRPGFLQKQLAALLQQTFPAFEIVISDNDPEASAKAVALSFNDQRVRYFHNEENLGMIRSFNKSIERAGTECIVMITDDDPVELPFLESMYELFLKYPGYSIYCAFERKNKRPEEIEVVDKRKFLAELLDTSKTVSILWSSCIILRQAALQVGKIPDYGSPHLSDHAFLALVGSQAGGVFINKMFSVITMHENNFSRLNIHLYISSCKGFYETMMAYAAGSENAQQNREVIIKHISHWFIANIFNLKRYYTLNKNENKLGEIEDCAMQILQLPFMANQTWRYNIKNMTFKVKRALQLLS